MGLAMGGYTGLLHAGLCAGRADSDSGLGDNPSPRQSRAARVHPSGMLAAYPAIAPSADIGRQYWLELLHHTTSMVIARNTRHNVRVSPQGQRQQGVTWKS